MSLSPHETVTGGLKGDRRVAAVGLAVAGFALFSVGDAFVKHLSAGYPVPQLFFFNALFALIPILVLARRDGGRRQLATRRPLVQLIRGVLGMTVGLGAFHAFSHLPMADVYAILFAAPLLTAGVSALFFGEKLDGAGWLAVLAGFGGVLITLRPSGDSYDTDALAALIAAAAFTGSGLVIRHWGREETPASFPFYGCLLGVVTMGAVLPFVFVPPTFQDLVLFLVGGLCAGSGLCCMLNAFRLAPAPLVAPYHYSQMIWGVIAGLLVFGDEPTPAMALGSAIIIACGLYLLLRERRRVG